MIISSNTNIHKTTAKIYFDFVKPLALVQCNDILMIFIKNILQLSKYIYSKLEILCSIDEYNKKIFCTLLFSLKSKKILKFVDPIYERIEKLYAIKGYIKLKFNSTNLLFIQASKYHGLFLVHKHR